MGSLCDDDWGAHGERQDRVQTTRSSRGPSSGAMGGYSLLQHHSSLLLPPPPIDFLLWNHEGWKRSLRLSRPIVNPSPPHPSVPCCWELGTLLQPGSSDISAGTGYEKPLINSLTH